MSRKVVNQSSECYASCICLDVANEPFVPANLRYKIDNISDDINVVPYTDIAGPTASTRIAVTASQNAMSNGGLRETRRVTFEVLAPGGGITRPYADYDLVRTNPL